MINFTPAHEEGSAAIWWLGQSGFLISCAGGWLCFDPYLSDSLTRKYAATDKPHVRMKPLVADPGVLTFVDVATSTHNHTDHLDAETLHAMKPRELVIPEANRAFVAERLGCDAAWPHGLAVGGSCTVGPFEFEAVPAKHEELTPEYLGYVVRVGGLTFYHSGDTLLYEGMASRLRELGPIDVAFLPINGRAPERRVAGNLNAHEAAWLGREIEARLVVPCHYDMFEFNTADPSEFVREAEAVGCPYRVMELGERFVLTRR